MGRSLSVIVLAAGWVATWRPQVDPDAWWHLSIGDIVVSTGALPATEPFSWLTTTHRFVAHSWLWDVLMAWAYGAAGATGTSLLALPLTAIAAVLVWVLVGLAAPTLPLFGRAAVVALAMASSLPLWAPRGQTLDIVFVLAVVLIAARYLRLGDRLGLILLPFIGILWANLHGSAVLGLLASMAIGTIALHIGTRWGTWPRRAVLPLLAASAAATAAVMINPYGPGLLAYPFDRAVASAFSAEIVEWRPPDFRAPELLMARGILAASLLVAAALERRRSDPFLLLTAAAWTFAALGSARFLPIALAVLLVAVAPAISLAVARWLGTEGAPAADRAGMAQVHAAPLLAITTLATISMFVVGWWFIAPSSQAAAIEHRMPVAAVDALKGSRCDGRILPAYGWAGYIIRSGRPVGAYGNSAEGPLTEQAGVEMVTTDPRLWLDAHDVDITLMPVGGALSHWLDEADDWRLEYRDSQATIHVRSDRVDCHL